jgi:signal transduction histidine kinase
MRTRPAVKPAVTDPAAGTTRPRPGPVPQLRSRFGTPQWLRSPQWLRDRIGIHQWLRSRLGVRLRSALAAAAVAGIAMSAAGLVLVGVTHATLSRNLDAAATQRATQIAAILASGDQIRLTQSLRPDPGERTVVQVLDQNGRIVAASSALGPAPAISGLRPGPGRTSREERRLPLAGRDARFRIAAVGIHTNRGFYVVLVGQSVHSVTESTEVVAGILVIGLPPIAFAIGAATFLFVGRALRPVEAMRRRAITITASNLGARLPVPAAYDEVAALATTMNDMLARIETASDAQRRFVADASHELRSPLATIHAGLDLLTTAQLPPSAATHVSRMYLESTRMAALIEDLLLLARFDEHGPRPRDDDVDLDDLAYAERDRVAELHPDLRVEATIAPVRIRGDVRHLHRALRNLVDNAAGHARSVVTITLAVATPSGPSSGPAAAASPVGSSAAAATVARLVVGNDGAVIQPEDHARIFERFVRLDDARARSHGGTGLGLSITRDIVTAHGGTIAITTLTPGSGTAFQVDLPLPEPPNSIMEFNESSGLVT